MEADIQVDKIRDEALEIMGKHYHGVDMETMFEDMTKLSALVTSLTEPYEDIYHRAHMVAVQKQEEEDMSATAAESHMKASPAYAKYRALEVLLNGMKQQVRNLRTKLRTSQFEQEATHDQPF